MMPDTAHAKLTPTHLRRAAIVYVRQSSPSQLERNTESTARQYALGNRAVELGFARHAVVVIDEDLGVSGSGTAERSGFARLAAEVALGRVGLVLGLEASRLARNNADWYRLLDLCAITDTIIGDDDGLYDPKAFNDRLVLGLKGTMSEAELHVLRARLEGGIRNKAARGELRRGLPVGLVWGEEDGEIRLHPDEAVCGAIRTVFERFAEVGSVRAVWLWFRAEGLAFPLQATTLGGPEAIRWATPTYTAIHKVVTHPAYAGAYVYGRTRHERYVTEQGQVRTRSRRLPRAEWEVLIPDHHPGFIGWETYQANQARIGTNIRPRAHQPGGAVREGAALLQGIAVCGKCGRHLAVHYRGRSSTPGYHCAGRDLVGGRGVWCLTVGGVQIDQAVADAFLAALTPAGLRAAVAAAEQLEADHDAAIAQWCLQAEQARYQAAKAERRYLAVDPDNRLVARGLERDWEAKLAALAAAEAELAGRQQQRPRALTAAERAAIAALGSDVERVWSAATTTDRDRKELLRTLLEEVIVTVDRQAGHAELTLRWRGGAITELTVDLPHSQPPKIRTSEDTIALIGRLAAHYPDQIIAGILNRQGRRSARGQRFTASIVQSLRHHWKIGCYHPPATPPGGELVTITQAAKILGVVPSTVHRWLADGFIAGEQPTPGAPWRIRMTDQLRGRFVEQAPEGWLPMLEATKALGVSRQTVLQRVKRGELRAVHVRTGRRKGLRIEVPKADGGLFDTLASTKGAV
jgi:DNA invertase Pin-like site-specific DNA recombinase